MNTEPAFPFNWEDRDGFKQVEHGLTKREYFAAHCPDVPDWFVHTPLPKGFEYPKWMDIKDEKDREEVRQWVHDGTWDLPEHLFWFQEKTAEAMKLSNRWEVKDSENRFFQWRTYYADALIKQLNK